ncbi:MAG: UDP-N-acetylmuramate dehydrogenase [Phaeodactylibacter sp.]|uniref:UDP-N-acetylmuramate dehydrogenase n=1 Tax=Phaeodactylibacter sp. TaxID=1940289 RepID=UPI0032ECD4A6
MIRAQHSLQSYNTFGIDARARWFSEIETPDALQALLKQHPDRPLFVLGGGSNLLLTRDLDQWVLHNRISGKSIVREEANNVVVRIGGGENWHETVLWSLQQGYGGLENLSLIPGTAGAAPIQNIGAYGVELSEVFERLEAIDLQTGERLEFTAEEAAFGYRDSLFKRALKGKIFITHIHLKLTRQKHACNTSYGALKNTLEEWGIHAPAPADISRAVIHIRQSKLPDPAELGNSGSFFKNPVIDKVQFESLRQQYPQVPGYPMSDAQVKVPAGWLIEQAGWKGKRVGSVGTYPKQALVLVNYGGAKGEAVWALARQIMADVKQQFSIDLQPEVNVL